MAVRDDAYGFEWTGKYAYNEWLRFDGEVTGTHARFKGFDTEQAVAFASYLAGGRRRRSAVTRWALLG